MKLKEIAKLANVSVGTVSKVINKREGVGKEKRKEIDEILVKSGFYKRHKQNQEENEMKNVAVVVPDLQNPYFGEIIKNISKILRTNEYQVLIFDTDEKFELEEEAITSILKNNICGVIMCICDGIKSKSNIENLKNANIPLVLIDRELEFHQDGVFLDDFKAGYIATEALIKEGHTKIGVLTGPLNLQNLKNRYLGYVHALKDYNISEENSLVIEGDMRYFDKSNYEQIRKVICNKIEITGIVSFNNFMTLNLLRFLNEEKNEKHSKLSLIGFEIPTYFEILNLNTSSIVTSTSEMGKLAGKLLIDKLTNGADYTQKIILQPQLELKGSEKKH